MSTPDIDLDAKLADNETLSSAESIRMTVNEAYVGAKEASENYIEKAQALTAKAVQETKKASTDSYDSCSKSSSELCQSGHKTLSDSYTNCMSGTETILKPCFDIPYIEPYLRYIFPAKENKISEIIPQSIAVLFPQDESLEKANTLHTETESMMKPNDASVA
jgi:hypothetical protein